MLRQQFIHMKIHENPFPQLLYVLFDSLQRNVSTDSVTRLKEVNKKIYYMHE